MIDRTTRASGQQSSLCSTSSKANWATAVYLSPRHPFSVPPENAELGPEILANIFKWQLGMGMGFSVPLQEVVFLSFGRMESHSLHSPRGGVGNIHAVVCSSSIWDVHHKFKTRTSCITSLRKIHAKSLAWPRSWVLFKVMHLLSQFSCLCASDSKADHFFFIGQPIRQLIEGKDNPTPSGSCL